MINPTPFEKIRSQAAVARKQDRFAHLQGELDTDLPWIAEEFSHLYYLPVYDAMTRKERLHYNQLFAVTTAEQIAFFEVTVPNEVHRRERGATASAELKGALEDFETEELEHAAMFDAWLAKARPALGLRGPIFRAGAGGRALLRMIFWFRRFFVFWSWALFYIEERTTIIGRRMLKDKASYDRRSADMQIAHMKDEMRHLVLTHELIREFWDPASRGLKAVNLWILRGFLNFVFFRPYSARSTWSRLVESHPRLRAFEPEVLAGLRTLGKDPRYLRQLLSREACPKFWIALGERAETRKLQEHWAESWNESLGVT